MGLLYFHSFTFDCVEKASAVFTAFCSAGRTASAWRKIRRGLRDVRGVCGMFAMSQCTATCRAAGLRLSALAGFAFGRPQIFAAFFERKRAGFAVKRRGLASSCKAACFVCGASANGGDCKSAQTGVCRGLRRCGRRKTKQLSFGRGKKFHHHGQKNQSWNYGCIGLCRH